MLYWHEGGLWPYEIGLAFALDLILGDPSWIWHPIRLIGQLILVAENAIRQRFRSLFWGGLWLALGIPLFCGGLVWGLLFLARVESPRLEAAVSILLIYFCLSVRDLGDHAMAVLKALSHGTLSQA